MGCITWVKLSHAKTLKKGKTYQPSWPNQEQPSYETDFGLGGLHLLFEKTGVVLCKDSNIHNVVSVKRFSDFDLRYFANDFTNQTGQFPHVECGFLKCLCSHSQGMSFGLQGTLHCLSSST